MLNGKKKVNHNWLKEEHLISQKYSLMFWSSFLFLTDSTVCPISYHTLLAFILLRTCSYILQGKPSAVKFNNKKEHVLRFLDLTSLTVEYIQNIYTHTDNPLFRKSPKNAAYEKLFHYNKILLPGEIPSFHHAHIVYSLMNSVCYEYFITL